MKYGKIFGAICKDFEKKGEMLYAMHEMNGQQYYDVCIGAGYGAAFIWSRFWPFNFDMVARKTMDSERNRIFDMDRLLKKMDSMDYKTALRTGAMKISKERKPGTLVEIATTDNSISVWVNEKYLEWFDEDCWFEVCDQVNLIKIYESDILVGVVLPVRTFN